MRTAVVLFVLLVGLIVVRAAPAAASTRAENAKQCACRVRAKRPRPPSSCVLLMFHGGGFVLGTPSIPDAEAAGANTGCHVREVNYALGDLGAAWRDAQYAARGSAGRKSQRLVLAYGESAGADLAARLAEKGEVRAAVAYLVPANLQTGIVSDTMRQMIASTSPTQAELDALAPDQHRSRRPILAQIAWQDLLLDTGVAWDWATRDPRVDAQQVEGTHVWPPTGDARASQLAAAVHYLINKKKATH